MPPRHFCYHSHTHLPGSVTTALGSPLNSSDFSSLPLAASLLDNLSSLGFAQMTPIQSQSLPAILQGQDVIAQGKTGSGKTVAFGLGLLHKLDVKQFRVQALVLCPTRELADQVAKELRKLARSIHNIKILTLCGGMPLGPQIGSLQHGAHIIVGTPGRVEEHLRKGTLELQHLHTLVLDEADRMLDMGFQPTLDAIMAHAPRQRQTLLFSATYPQQIKDIARRVMQQPVMIQAATQHQPDTIRQHFYLCQNNGQRLTTVKLLLLHYRPESAVVFCNTKQETQDIANELRQHGFIALALHGDLEQRQRDQALVRFANKSCTVLVATDVAARGLDIDAVDAVINYQIARDTEVHTHRIGRTGRGGNSGKAHTLFTEQDSFKLARLQEDDEDLTLEALPSAALLEQPGYPAKKITLQLDAGKKQKVRPGDILGALTAHARIAGAQVGKIHIFDHCAYVAVDTDIAQLALQQLSDEKMKGRHIRARLIRQ